MIGKDFLAKLLSRWIYPGLVLVDSGTFSLLSRFLFMTCHLLQQASREPLASSSRCRSGTRRHCCREPLTPFQERCRGPAGHPDSPTPPGSPCAARRCRRGGRRSSSCRLRGGCCASDTAMGFIMSCGSLWRPPAVCAARTVCGMGRSAVPAPRPW